MANFGEVRRAQLAKSTLLTSSLVPLGSFKVCWVAKERMGCGKQREATAPIKFIVKLQPWFLCLRWKTCLRQNCSLDFSACSEGPAFGLNTLMMVSHPFWSRECQTLSLLCAIEVCITTEFVDPRVTNKRLRGPNISNSDGRLHRPRLGAFS